MEIDNQEYVRKASEVVDFWVNNSQQESGLVSPWADAYVDRKATWRDYEAYMRVAAGGMEGMMGAWNIMKKHGINKPEWLSYCKKYADWLVRNQEKDGSFYLRYDWRTGKPTHDSKYTTTNIIRFLIELYSVTQNKRYLDTALKAGEFSYDFIHHDYLYVGGVIDNPNVKDRESGQMAIYAFLALYDVTGDAKWKEAAIQAARYTETFMFAYHVPMAINDTLTDFPKDVSIVGQTLIATGHSAIDNGLAFSSFQYYRLYLMTGDTHFLEMAKLIQNNTLSIMDLDGDMRYRYRGLLTECFNPQSNRGHSVRQQLPWNQASILEPMHRFMDAFGECAAGKGFAAILRRERENACAPCLDLDDVAHGLVKQRAIGTQRNHERAGLNEGDRSVLEFSRGVGLGVDIGDLLELQGPLHAERIVQVPADEEHGIVIEILRGVILDLLAAGQDLLDLRGQRGDGCGQAVRLFGADRIALRGEIDGQQIQHSHLRGIRLGRRDGDLRPGPGVEHVVRFAGNGAADDVDDRQNSRAEALCLTQRGHGVERLAGLADNNGKRPFVYNRAAIAELRGQNDLDRHPRQLFEIVFADHAHMI